MSRVEKPLLLFFTCVRSGPCRRMESVLDQVARKERHRVDVLRIDVEAQAGLAQRLGVGEAPALVLVQGKRVAGRLDGRSSAATIERFLASHLRVPATA